MVFLQFDKGDQREDFLSALFGQWFSGVLFKDRGDPD